MINKKGMFILLMLISGVGFAKDSAQKGQQKSVLCVACHNQDGNSTNPLWPKIAGQHASYLYKQMKAFKKGKQKGGRYDASMTPMMAGLSKQEMKNLAQYFASQKPKIEVAKQQRLKQGEALYRGGNLTKGISACIACHGPKGKGNAQAGFPLLSGQHAEYTVKQLQAFKKGERHNDYNDIMQDISQRMSAQDMRDVANYISGLH